MCLFVVAYPFSKFWQGLFLKLFLFPLFFSISLFNATQMCFCIGYWSDQNMMQDHPGDSSILQNYKSFFFILVDFRFEVLF